MSPNPIIENIPLLTTGSVIIDTLRLDQIHPIISGNKWYKLKYYLSEAISLNATTLASFGGPYSNHLVALAYAASLKGLKSIGYVRANKDEPVTHTLQEAISYGMQLEFLGRQHFQAAKIELLNTASKTQNQNVYLVDEGGYGAIGAKGAADILNTSIPYYDYIICAVGTGTMVAGIINAKKIDKP